MLVPRSALLLLALALPPAAQVSAAPTLILGHRGVGWNHAANLFPENTALSVYAALVAGADGVEIDVVKTADDVFAVRHDDYLGVASPGGMARSNCRGLISDRVWDELRGCRANPHNRRGFSTPMSRLEDVLVLSDRAVLVLDVKNDAHGTEPLRTVSKLVALLESYHALGRTILMVYEPTTVGFAVGLGARTCLKQHHLHGLSRPQMADIVAETGAWGGCTWSRLLRPDYVRAMGRHNLAVVTYHLSNTPGPRFDKSIRKFLGQRVFAVITDQIERAAQLRGGAR